MATFAKKISQFLFISPKLSNDSCESIGLNSEFWLISVMTCFLFGTLTLWTIVLQNYDSAGGLSKKQTEFSFSFDIEISYTDFD